ncbi:MAG: hypothetical protein HC880_19140 [Bacteroidia bacterium]|nr:hypothetical protein [Bacteroidia bacterium]
MELSKSLFLAKEINFCFKDKRILIVSNEVTSQNDIKLTFNSTILKSNSEKIKSPENLMDVIKGTLKSYRVWRKIQNKKYNFGWFIKNRSFDNGTILELVVDENHIFVTNLSGDMGSLNFYVTGYMGENLGLFFNKLIINRIDYNDISIKLSSSRWFR